MFDLDRFLSIPICVAVGDRDGRRDVAFNCSPRIDDAQGDNRIQRARSWVRALRHQAKRRGIRAHIEFRLLPGATHTFTQNARKAGLDDEVSHFFFPRMLRHVPARGNLR